MIHGLNALVLATTLTLAPTSKPINDPPPVPVFSLPAIEAMDLPTLLDDTDTDSVDQLSGNGVDPIGRLFVLIAPSDDGPAAVVVFDVPADGAPVQRERYETSISGATAISQQEPAVDPSGRFLFVPGGLGDDIAVLEIAADGTISEVFGSPFAAVGGSFQLAVHPSGEFLFSSAGVLAVQSFAIAADGSLNKVDEQAAFSSRDIELTPDGNRLYVAEGFSGARGFDVLPDGRLAELMDSPFRFVPSSRPFELEISSDGESLYIQDLDAGVFAFRIETSGDLAHVSGSPFAIGEFSRPARLTADDRYLYVASSAGPRIHGFRVEPDRTLSRLSGSPFAGGSTAPIELIEVTERQALVELTRTNQIRIHDILEDGYLITNTASATLVDGFGRTITGAVFVPVVTNSPPQADAGDDSTAECSGPEGALVTLDGSGSSDPDSSAGTNDDIVLFEWLAAFGSPEQQALGEGQTIQAPLAVGSQTITLRVTDSAGLESTDELVVTVGDSLPPHLSVSVTPTIIWPPNHAMVTVTATFDIDDVCGPTSFALLSVDSSEPSDGTGDGSTSPDVDGVEVGAPDAEFRVRAERSGSGPGRTYTVRYRATDGAGNETEATAECVVPHSQGGN